MPPGPLQLKFLDSWTASDHYHLVVWNILENKLLGHIMARLALKNPVWFLKHCSPSTRKLADKTFLLQVHETVCS